LDITLAKIAFKKFSENHNLSFTERNFETVENAFDYIFGVQKGLSFEFSLGLTGNELHIGYEGFWTYIYPAEEKIDWMISLANGVINNTCRLATHANKSVVYKRVLEMYENGEWITKYTANEKLTLPFQKIEISYIYNSSKPILHPPLA